jgi:putative ABC transport system substrate-binding protein
VNRRDFISLVGGAAAAWPLAARAQHGEQMRRIGVLAGGAATSRTEFAAFQQALEQLGWSEGRNLRIEYRWGLGNPANIRKHVDELVALAPDVILVAGASPLAPLLQATRELPIVFVSVVDPVGAGLVASLSRPGANATRLHAIRIQLERQVAAAAQGGRADSDAGGCAA